MFTILVINPNSSSSITDGLESSLVLGQIPADVNLQFYTAPPHAPPAITDHTTSVLTAQACFEDIVSRDLFTQYDAFLVCCFSNHPLTSMLRSRTDKPAMGIFDAGLAHALAFSSPDKRFGVLSTGPLDSFKWRLYDNVQNWMGGTSERFLGADVSGLGVVELREWVNGGEAGKQKVEKLMKESAIRLKEKGVEVVLLGCAGMAGMDCLVREAYGEMPVMVIDGTKAGIQMLSGLLRLRFFLFTSQGFGNIYRSVPVDHFDYNASTLVIRDLFRQSV